MEKAKQIKAELYQIFKSFVNTNNNNYNFKKIIKNQQYEQILLILQLIENKHILNNLTLKDNWIENGITQFIEVIYDEYGEKEYDIGKESIIKPFLRWYANVYKRASNYNNQNILTITKYDNLHFTSLHFNHVFVTSHQPPVLNLTSFAFITQNHPYLSPPVPV